MVMAKIDSLLWVIKIGDHSGTSLLILQRFDKDRPNLYDLIEAHNDCVCYIYIKL